MEISSGLAAILGALVGGGITVIVTWIQQRQQSKRDLIRIAFDLAVADHKQKTEIALKRGGSILPIESYVLYYIKIINHAVGKNITMKTLSEIRKFNDELNDFYWKDAEKDISKYDTP